MKRPTSKTLVPAIAPEKTRMAAKVATTARMNAAVTIDLRDGESSGLSVTQRGHKWRFAGKAKSQVGQMAAEQRPQRAEALFCGWFWQGPMGGGGAAALAKGMYCWGGGRYVAGRAVRGAAVGVGSGCANGMRPSSAVSRLKRME